MKCADCHMPRVPSNDPAAKNGMVRSHRFPAANTALPFVNGDAEQLRITQKFLQDNVVSVDVFGFVRGEEGAAPAKKAVANVDQDLASTFAVGEESMNFGARQAFISKPAEVVAPLGKVDAVVRAGESIRLEVVVRTRKIGHFFPGGTVDAFDVWVELEAVDEQGRTVFHSGAVEKGGKGPVESGAHFYRSLQLDEHGNVINKRNAWSSRSVAYVRLIPPGAADTIHYRMRIPDDAKGTITLKAKVNYRKFAWWNTQWAYRRRPRSERERRVDYAVARRSPVRLHRRHLEGLRRHEAHPGHPDHRHGARRDNAAGRPEGNAGPGIRDVPRQVGAGAVERLRHRAAVAGRPQGSRGGVPEGDGDGAGLRRRLGQRRPRAHPGRQHDRRGGDAAQGARRSMPAWPRRTSSSATALKSLGRYDEALTHLRTASDKYPRDRVVLNQLGRVLFLKRQYEPAVEAFNRVLAIDPEDLQAHYNLMLWYRGLGKTELADREEALYRRFKADESSQAITGPYRQLHPDDNNERQSIHEHVTVRPSPTR